MFPNKRTNHFFPLKITGENVLPWQVLKALTKICKCWYSTAPLWVHTTVHGSARLFCHLFRGFFWYPEQRGFWMPRSRVFSVISHFHIYILKVILALFPGLTAWVEIQWHNGREDLCSKKREASQLFSIQTSRSVSISNWSLVKYFTCPETTTQQSPCLTYLETYLYSYLESIEGNVSSPKQKRKVIKKTFEQKLTGTSSALCWEQACFKQAYSDNHEYTPALPPLCSIQHQGKRTKLSFQ